MASPSKPKSSSGFLQPKDMITVGVFTALYFVMYFFAGMLAFVPALVVVAPLIDPLITGIPFMLFLTKVKSFGMVTVMGLLLGILFFFGMQNWMSIPIGFACGLVSDLVLKSGDYRGWRTSVLGYALFSQWAISAVIPLFLMRDAYFSQVREGWGDAYADSLLAMTPDWLLGAMVVMIFVGAVAGAYLGRAVLRKHFKRAGIA